MKFLSGRQLRSVKVTSVRWQRRAMFLMGGIAVGAAAVALAELADWAAPTATAPNTARTPPAISAAAMP